MRFACADAGSEFCPCYLGVSGECLVCNQMHAQATCDCDWAGVCVYDHFSRSLRKEAKPRQERRAKVLWAEKLNADHLLFAVELPPSFTAQLRLPGSFVFAKPVDRPFSFYLPLGVLKADHRSSTFLLKTVGPKSKALSSSLLDDGTGKSEDSPTELDIKGPHWNGVFGLKTIRSLKMSNALMVLRGIGQALAIGVALELLRHGNSVRAIIDPAEVGQDLVGDDLEAMGCKVSRAEIRTSQGLAALASVLLSEQPACVFSGGPDGQHYRIEKLLGLLGLSGNTALTGSNNSIMVCGEGTCGACFRRVRSSNPSKLKACKGNVGLSDIVPDTSQWK